MSEAPPSLRALNSRLGIVGRLAAILILLAAIVLVLSMRGLGRAMFVPSAKEAKTIQKEQIAKLVADYTTSTDGHVKQFNGRSVFFVPSAPVPPPPPPPEHKDEDVKPPPPPPPPPSYAGPKLIAMINGVAWFDDGKKLAPGAEVKDKLRVKELLSPWGAKLEWDGVEFTVSLFDRDKVIYKQPESAKDPSHEPAKETPPTDVKAGDKPDVKPPDAGKPDQPKPDAPKPAGPKPDEPKPETPKPETPKPEGTPPPPANPETPKPDEPKPADPKPDSPTSPPSAGQTGNDE